MSVDSYSSRGSQLGDAQPYLRVNCCYYNRATPIIGPLVSIIIPTKNSMNALQDLLRSISEQNYVNKEIIVIDNYSSDGTQRIASKFGAKVILARTERSKARNLGAEQAIGEYLLFLDSDMELSSGVLINCVDVIQTGRYGACIVREVTDGKGYWANVRSLERRTYEGDSLFETATFFKRDVFFQVGRFSEALVGFEDYDLQARLEEAHINIGYVRSPIIHHEGKLVLSKHLMKKKYYVQTGKNYIFRNKQRNLMQLQPIRRSFIKNWRIIVRRPNYAVGIIVLKGLEAIVGLISLFS